MKIPFLDLGRQDESIHQEIMSEISKVIEKRAFIQGPFMDEFEAEFSKNHGAKVSIGCSSGTSALTVLLKSMNIGHGDQVLTVGNTFFATVESILLSGADFGLVDIDPETHLMCPKDLEKKITSRTRAVIPVHLYGNPAKMDEIKKICQEYDLLLFEDCAQSHLGTYQGKPLGTFGVGGTFSFYPGKNLGAYGDAGMIITQDESIEKRIRMEINHGRQAKYEHEFFADNYRMDGIQAAILKVKLGKLREWTAERRRVALRYDEAFRGNENVKIVKSYPGEESVYHLYVVEVENREKIQEKLKSAGISTGVHYPIALADQPAVKKVSTDFETPIAREKSNKILSLPVFPYMKEDEQEYVISRFLEAIDS